MGKPYWDLEKRLQSAKNLWTLKKKEVLVRKETSGEPFKSQCKQVRLDAFDHLSLPTNWAVEVSRQSRWAAYQSVLLINTVVWRISENHNSVKIKKCVLARFSVYKSVIWNFYKNLYGLKYFSPARIFFPEFTTGKRSLVSWYKIIASWQDSSLPHLNSLKKKVFLYEITCLLQSTNTPFSLASFLTCSFSLTRLWDSKQSIKYIYTVILPTWP